MLDHSSTISTEETIKKPDKDSKKSARYLFKYFFLVIGGIFVFILLFIGILVFKFPLLAQATYNFITAKTDQISSYKGNVNILVLGKSGGNHEGADLTDTMILASVSLDNKGIKMISIPRDIWIPEIRAKINSAYYWGKTGSLYIESNIGGIGLAKKFTQEVTGQPIQYGVVVDFSLFKEVVDTLGGIQVDVKNGFTDNLYPIEGKENDTCDGDPTFACRYETVIFYPGIQTMNGDTALKYVRSRHADGTEGTDIAREARQQDVIDAIKDKIAKPSTFLSPKVDIAMINILGKYVETDINMPVAGTLGRYVFKGSKSIVQFLIPENLLVNPPISKTYDNLYVFIPKLGNGKWTDINSWFASILGG